MKTFKFIEVIEKTLNVKPEHLGSKFWLTYILMIWPSSPFRQQLSLQNVEITMPVLLSKL